MNQRIIKEEVMNNKEDIVVRFWCPECHVEINILNVNREQINLILGMTHAVDEASNGFLTMTLAGACPSDKMSDGGLVFKAREIL